MAIRLGNSHYDYDYDTAEATTEMWSSTSTRYSSELHAVQWDQYVVNHSQLFNRYWLQFPPQTPNTNGGFGMLIAFIGLLSVVGNGIICIRLIRYK